MLHLNSAGFVDPPRMSANSLDLGASESDSWASKHVVDQQGMCCIITDWVWRKMEFGICECRGREVKSCLKFIETKSAQEMVVWPVWVCNCSGIQLTWVTQKVTAIAAESRKEENPSRASTSVVWPYFNKLIGVVENSVTELENAKDISFFLSFILFSALYDFFK